MAGHSKWANIKHKKAKEDAKRGKIFTKLIREITVAAKLGGGDASSNPRLRAAIDAALSSNMTRDTIDRAVKRGAGGQDGADVEEVTYEGYGPAGVAVLVECMTDNRNRTVAEVRHAFSKSGGNLGTDGSVSYLFSRKGIISFDKSTNEEQLMEIALEAGAEDFEANDDGTFDIITSFEQFGEVKDALDNAGLKAENAEVSMIASTEAELNATEAEKVIRLLDMLEDLDDVQKVHSNASISDEILDTL